MTSSHHGLVLAALAVVMVAACGNNDETAVIDPGDGGEYAPAVDPANFVDTIDNPYLPYGPGARWVYEGVSDGEHERVEVVVTGEREDGHGDPGNAWCATPCTSTGNWSRTPTTGSPRTTPATCGTSAKTVENYADGTLVDRDGSWEAGVGGALPGIVMPADPTVGDAYRQEFLRGEAEDMAEVIGIGGRQRVPAGSFDDVVTTRDWTPLEPDVVEEKQYAPGVGMIRETTVGAEGAVELVEFTPPD